VKCRTKFPEVTEAALAASELSAEMQKPSDTASKYFIFKKCRFWKKTPQQKGDTGIEVFRRSTMTFLLTAP